MNHVEKKIIVIILLIAVSIAGFVYWGGENFLQTLVEKKVLGQDQKKENKPPQEKLPPNASVTINLVSSHNGQQDIIFDFSHETALVGFSLDLVVTSSVQISDVTCIAQFSCHSIKANNGRYRVSFLALPNVQKPILKVGKIKVATITYTITGNGGSLHIDEGKSEIRSAFSEQNLLKVKMKRFAL